MNIRTSRSHQVLYSLHSLESFFSSPQPCATSRCFLATFRKAFTCSNKSSPTSVAYHSSTWFVCLAMNSCSCHCVRSILGTLVYFAVETVKCWTAKTSDSVSLLDLGHISGGAKGWPDGACAPGCKPLCPGRQAVVISFRSSFTVQYCISHQQRQSFGHSWHQKAEF